VVAAAAAAAAAVVVVVVAAAAVVPSVVLGDTSFAGADNADMHFIHIIACPCGCFGVGEVPDLVPCSYESAYWIEATEVKELLDHVGRLGWLFGLFSDPPY